MKTTEYVAVVVLVAVAAAVHFAAGLDWPWAVVAGAAASLLARQLLHRHLTARL